MDSGLRLEMAVSILTLHREGDALDSCLFARLVFQYLCLVALLVGPTQVHAKQHLRPVLRLRAPGPRGIFMAMALFLC